MAEMIHLNLSGTDLASLVFSIASLKKLFLPDCVTVTKDKGTLFSRHGRLVQAGQAVDLALQNH